MDLDLIREAPLTLVTLMEATPTSIQLIRVCDSYTLQPGYFICCDSSPRYRPYVLYTTVGMSSEDQVCGRFNRGYCKHQEDSHCIWIPKNGGG